MPDEIEQNSTKTIIIDRRSPVGVDAEVTFSVNGVSQTVPVGVPVEVREDMLSALENSDRTFTVVATGEEAAGVDLAGGGAVSGVGAMAVGESQQAGAGSRDGANDSGPAGHVDKDNTGTSYAPDPGALGATGEEGKELPPTGALTAKEQGEQNGTAGGSDELGGEMDKAQQGDNVIQDGEVKKRPEPETAGTSATETEGEQSSGDEQSSTDAFDPEAAIKGTVPEVKAKLAGLTPEQLDQVKASETDRESPRSGVLSAIDEAKAKHA